MSRRGMTLMELMMVIIVVGILAATAIPNYTRTVERQHFRGAQDILQAIYAGQQVYFVANDGVYRAQPATMQEWRDDLYIDDPNMPPGGPVAYAIANPGGPATFTATATRNGGPFNGGTVTINQDRATGTGAPWPP